MQTRVCGGITHLFLWILEAGIDTSPLESVSRMETRITGSSWGYMALFPLQRFRLETEALCGNLVHSASERGRLFLEDDVKESFFFLFLSFLLQVPPRERHLSVEGSGTQTASHTRCGVCTPLAMHPLVPLSSLHREIRVSFPPSFFVSFSVG